MKKGHHGEVTSVGEHHSGNGKFARVEVAHGKRPTPPKKKKGDNGNAVGFYDDRPTSTIVVPKEDAGRYHIGQKVSVHLPHLSKSDAEKGDSHDDAMDDYRSTQRSITKRGKSRS